MPDADKSDKQQRTQAPGVAAEEAAAMPRKRRSRLRGKVVLAVFAAVATALLATNWHLVTGTLEERRIAATRAKHRGLWAIGRQLPGTPDLQALDKRLDDGGFDLKQPILMRIFKREFELEVWKARDGRYHHFATYPICRWAGRLGPKLAEGDKQTPEGFYAVGKSQLNPASRWHRSFNLGFPNLFDRAHGRTGSFLMVHGGCGSVGCYAMTDDVIDEIWRLVTAAIGNGQKRFQVQAFPFRMTQENLAAKSGDPLYAFWRSLKSGADLFEQTGLPPRVRVCKGQYVFLPGRNIDAGAVPAIATCGGSNARDSGRDS
ncbi:MAG: murein L,D-transpeptidase [Hyphomicrobiaceae bacterium]|nr:murein L,D-transpeptidase [Hyphomicrobiaceae bacterium]MCC0009153.1 murein L,D-transpeptidase [Hyphomicrobiaceae bacterium]